MAAQPGRRAAIWHHATRSGLLALLLSLGLGALAPAPTLAHSFLLESDPAAGARLSGSPTQLSLRFTEPVAAATIALRTSTGGAVPTAAGQPEDGGLVVVATLGETLADGVYIVSYQVLSADDGHATAGEYAFAVGGSGAMPAGTAVGVGPAPLQAAAQWLLLVGLLIGFGALVAEWLVWRPLAAASGAHAPTLPVGRLLLVSSMGGLTLVLLQALTLVDLGRGDLSGIGASRSVVLLALGTGWTVVGLLFTGRPPLRPIALVPLGAALAFVVMAGHAGSAPPWAGAADLVHVGAVAIWTGGLAQVVAVLWQTRGRDLSGWQLAGVRRYASLALGAVALALLSGAVVAIAELREVDDLVTTPYGRVLLVKGAVVAARSLLRTSPAAGCRTEPAPGPQACDGSPRSRAPRCSPCSRRRRCSRGPAHRVPPLPDPFSDHRR